MLSFMYWLTLFRCPVNVVVVSEVVIIIETMFVIVRFHLQDEVAAMDESLT